MASGRRGQWHGAGSALREPLSGTASSPFLQFPSQGFPAPSAEHNTHKTLGTGRAGHRTLPAQDPEQGVPACSQGPAPSCCAHPCGQADLARETLPRHSMATRETPWAHGLRLPRPPYSPRSSPARPKVMCSGSGNTASGSSSLGTVGNLPLSQQPQQPVRRLGISPEVHSMPNPDKQHLPPWFSSAGASQES